jgi:ABC-type transporter Mla MlaB component
MTAPLVLPAEITIYVMTDLRAAWVAWLDGLSDAGTDLCADGSAVAELDAAGLQGLLALSRSVAARGRRLHLQPASDTLAQGCRRLGLAHLLAPLEGVPA